MRHPLRLLASFPLLSLLAFGCSDSGDREPAVSSPEAGSGGSPGMAGGATPGGAANITDDPVTDLPAGGTAGAAIGGGAGGADPTPPVSGDPVPVIGEPVAGDPFAVFYRGANLSGAEHGIENDGTEIWGEATPGIEGSQYAWPDPETNPEMDEIDLFLQRGMNFYRLPIAWERIQQTLNGPLDPGYLGRLHDTVDAIRSRGATVMIDIHNYARYKSQAEPDESPSPLIGSAEVPMDALADLWGKLASEFGEASETSPIWFDIMNEPHDIDAVVWATAANAAIAAIRDTGAQNVIMAPPVQWGTAWDFSWHEGMQNHTQDIVDPLDNLVIQVHQYSHEGDCATDPNDFVTLVGPAEEWARTNSRRLFLGEFNAGQDDACLPAINNLLTHVETNRLGQPDGVWLGWSVWAINARGNWQELDNDEGAEGHMTSTVVAHLPATCNDGTQSDDETAVDCGGSCRRCAAAQSCSTGNDCQSGVCSEAACQ